jgi:hypothetical protein
MPIDHLRPAPWVATKKSPAANAPAPGIRNAPAARATVAVPPAAQAPTPRGAAPAQAKLAGGVIQAKVQPCLVCGHRHGNKKCTVLVGTKPCGCVSHSYKHDSGGKFDPGSGKRERMLAARASGSGK